MLLSTTVWSFVAPPLAPTTMQPTPLLKIVLLLMTSFEAKCHIWIPQPELLNDMLLAATPPGCRK